MRVLGELGRHALSQCVAFLFLEKIILKGVMFG
jgi:hypothetical protein